MHLILLLCVPAVVLGAVQAPLPTHAPAQKEEVFPIGAPTQVDELNAEQKAITEFAFTQLTAGDPSCPKQLIKIENFTEQVVQGALYEFDIIMTGKKENGAACLNNGVEKRCRIAVWDKPWEKFREVQWDKVNCDNNAVLGSKQRGKKSPIIGAPKKVINLSDDNKAVVNLVFSQLQNGDDPSCPLKLIRVENFTQQVVQGTLYKFDIVLSGKKENVINLSDDNKAVVNLVFCSVEKRCTASVWDKPWENFREVQSVDCNNNLEGQE